VSLPIKKSAAETASLLIKKSAAQTASLPIQKSTAKTASLPMQKSAAMVELSIIYIYIFFCVFTFSPPLNMNFVLEI
jgi:hypothetical protein